MKDNKLIKFLIPLVAAVVVFESIVLVNNLEKSNNTSKTEDTKNEQKTEEVIVKEEPVINFSFNSTASAAMKIGKTYKVTLDLSSMKDKSVDGLETYVKYDPEFLKVTNLVSNSKLAKPEVSKINSELGIISNIILIENKEGLSLMAGEKMNLLTFSVTPIEEGIVRLELGSGESNKNYATLVVETGTAKSLGWTGEKLDINVTK